MDWKSLVREGVELRRPTIALRARGDGQPAGRWYGKEAFEVDENDFPCWLTVASDWIPSLKTNKRQFLSVFADEASCVGGYVEQTDDWPDRDGIDLFAEEIELMPPLEAIFMFGSNSTSDWLQVNKWERDWPFSMSFKDPIATAYVSKWEQTHPFYQKKGDIFALLGGWPQFWPENDWNELVHKNLCILTLQDSEPWIEVYQERFNEYRVVQRIT